MSAAAGSDQLLAFVKYLRGRDIPISPADSLDAIQVASLLGYSDRQQLKHGLAAVLAKSQADGRVFADAFELFFSTPAGSGDPGQTDLEAQAATPTGPADPAAADTSSAPPGAGDAEGGGADAHEHPLTAVLERHPDLAGLMDQSIVQSMVAGDGAAVAMAIEAAARAAGVDDIRFFTQRGQYMRKLLDALGEQSLREAAIVLEDRDGPGFEIVQQLRDTLRDKARDRVERAYLVHASGATEDFLDDALSEVKLGNVAPHQMARMRRLLERMARKLAARHGRRRVRARRGQLHVTATLRAAAATDGIPFTPHWRRVRRRKPQILAVCDVSGSVSAYARFLLMFLYALQDVLPRTRSFAFSSALGEVTEVFESLPVEEAIERVNHRYGGATDYARAFADFHDLALADINRSTTVVILGDARNNEADPRLDLLAEIKARCQQLIWLNPEPRRAWGSGDSAMLPVIRHCHIAAECNNLKQLERIVDKLLADLRRR